MIRAVVDTNVWVSAVIQPAGPSAAVVAAFRAGRFEALFSEPLLAELQRALLYPRLRLRHRKTAAEVATFVTDLRHECELVTLTTPLRLCRDPNDDMVVLTVLLSGAEVLVTGDADFAGSDDVVRVLHHADVRIVSPRDFAEELQGESQRGPGQPGDVRDGH